VAISDDVLVVGGGIAGMTAALVAAREGADVRIVSKKRSTLRQASGLVDVLGYEPDGTGPLVDPFEAIPDLPDGHPYERVGVEAVREGLALFEEVAGDAYRGGHTDRNALVPTHGGTVKPTARYPEHVAPGLASDDRDALLVGFESVTDFDAPLAADHLRAAGVPFDVAGVTLRFPKAFRDDARITRLARALDDDELAGRTEAGPTDAAAATDGGGDDRSTAGNRGVRSALAERVRPHLDGAERVGFPAYLGENHTREVRTDLSDALGAEVFEVPTGPPSVPGMRLESLYREALASAGVRVTTGDPVVDWVADGDLDAIHVDREGRTVPYEAGAVVLATGGLVGKGVDSDREGVREAVFDCHVPHPEDRYDWFDDRAFGDHRFARFGVEIDGDCRPLSSAGDPEFGNLFAAGAVLGGYDFAAEKSGSGVSLATGLVAGRRAAEVAR